MDKPNYALFENNDVMRARYVPGPSYQAIPGRIFRVEWRLFDVWGQDDQVIVDRNLLIVTVLLDRPGPEAKATQNFRFKEDRSKEGLRNALEVDDYPQLYGKRVIAHYDAGVIPQLVAISHPDAKLERIVRGQ